MKTEPWSASGSLFQDSSALQAPNMDCGSPAAAFLSQPAGVNHPEFRWRGRSSTRWFGGWGWSGVLDHRSRLREEGGSRLPRPKRLLPPLLSWAYPRSA
jgi:hypothetical protein